MTKAASAAGLFRATGKRAKPQAQQQLDGSFLKVENAERRADEFYPTPAEPVRALLHAEITRLRELGSCVWESSAGDGAITREMTALGLNVYSSDLVDRGFPLDALASYYEFTDWPIGGLKRVTVGNPPYDQINWRDGKARWVKHTRQVLRADYAAFYLSWSWPGAGGLAAVWDVDPPARVYLTRWKVDFTGDGSPPMLNAWFVWDGDTKPGDTRLLMLDRKDARQTELFDAPQP